MEVQTQEVDRFLDFLSRKNIDASALADAEPSVFQKWKTLFDQMHEESFLMHQKFHINPIRRKYPKTRYPSR